MKLTEAEIIQISTEHFDTTITGKEVELLEKELKIANTELQLLSANYTLKKREVEDIKQKVAEKKRELKDRSKRRTAVAEAIGERYGIEKSKKWGFDPLTGEISNE